MGNKKEGIEDVFIQEMGLCKLFKDQDQSSKNALLIYLILRKHILILT